MQDRYYLNNMSDAQVTINLSTKRVIEPHTSLPLNSKDVMVFKAMKAKRKDRISRFDSLKLSKIPLSEDSNYKALNNPVEEESAEVMVKEQEVEQPQELVVPEQQEPQEPVVSEQKETEESVTVPETDKDDKEPSDAAKEELIKKALEQGVSEQFI